ncbi:FUSC family protein [Embleya scabrispora]|uniref:FUSC family protein n=1 Tax=Embleya scabrispora TaxID=159449 RepID=UPI00036B7A0A|nr:aromatic acid exporter family protein [Embleya scabrispora]MYS84735.1 FUSC family protein [Streptomyces sp. SID5474]
MQSAKAALAAMLSWAVAGWWLQAPMAIMAPWVAILLVQATVYRSVAQAPQIMVSMAFGTLIAALAWVALGSTIGAMAAVLPITMLLGNWRRFGEQGMYSSTSALFVLSYGPVTTATVGHRLGEALLGAAIGLGVNFLLWPPVHLRDSRRAALAVADEIAEILADAADGLRDGWDTAAAEARYRRALRAFRRWEDLRSATEHARESVRMNPRIRRHGPVPELDHGCIPALEALVTRTIAITRTIRDAARRDGADLTPDGETLAPYAEFLDVLGRAVREYGRAVAAGTGGLPVPADEADAHGARVRHLRRELARAGELHAVLAERLPRAAKSGPVMTALTGSLLAEAGRIPDDLAATSEPGDDRRPTPEGKADLSRQ